MEAKKIELTEEEYMKVVEDSYKAGFDAAIEMLTKPKDVNTLTSDAEEYKP